MMKFRANSRPIPEGSSAAWTFPLSQKMTKNKKAKCHSPNSNTDSSSNFKIKTLTFS